MYKRFIANGVMLLFAYPLMLVVEKMFGFISHVTLIELSNTSKDLLRKMS
jgi:membrane-associated HD superfamily phosphohydrolase